MKEINFESVSLKGLAKTAKQIIAQFPDHRIFAFYGEMGSGKTTLIKQICEIIGAEVPVVSPTFSIINEYPTKMGVSVFHFDFYRLEKIEEAFDIGYEDYFYSGKYCFIEWPEKIQELLPEEYIRIDLETVSDSLRNITARFSIDM